ncbi:DUF6351 family protein, partial [Photobacterium sanctipauli]
MRKVIFGLLVLALIFFIAQQLGFEDPVASRQVKAVAEPQPNYLLDVKQHISQTPRPKETFPFPIQVGEVGPTQSLYSGKNLYPFYCMTVDSKLGQPLVDNQDGFGVPVYDTDEFEEFDREQLAEHLVGYSKDCSLPTRLAYVVVDRNKTLHLRTAQELALNPPAAGELLLRIEQGTINRYIYTIAMPIGIDEVGSQTSSNSWNQRLIYRFEGGSGIGFRQGRLKLFRLINKELDQLEKGYAVITSSGNKTSYGYNMLLAEDTARRVKTQFVSLFGEPLYTIGIGASGGGLAQYLIGQNSQGILDALMPLYSYPDMISVSTYALDCDLLNNYFSFRADKEQWQDWNKRQAVEGLRAINGAEQKFGWLQPLNQLLQGQFPDFPSGNNECINGYFGLSSYIYNPKQGFIKPFYHDSVVEQVNWHYWQEMAQVFGVDKQGFANSTWDNVGVQYGLEALLAGQILFDEFIDLNRQIGAWKPFNKMQPEQKLSLAAGLPPVWLSLWGNHNITNVTDNPASRFSADLTGIERAYRYGQIFIGQLTLPTIDIRHYLEDEL